MVAMSRLRVEDIGEIRDVELSATLWWSVLTLVAGSMTALLCGAFVAVSGLLPIGPEVAVVGVAAVVSALIVGNLAAGLFRIRNAVSEFLADCIEWSAAEREARYAKPAAPPAPPPAPPVVTVGVAEPELIGGIDARDLDYFDREIERVGWTERQWVGRTLPYGFDLSKGENGGYARLIQLYVDRGLIAERGGAGNKTGVMTVKDHAERMRVLRNRLPVLPAPAPALALRGETTAAHQ